MKYLKQFLIILAISFAGEVLHELLPLPIPASIYGIILLFFLLKTKILPLSSIKETAKFLIEIMPVMFIPAAVGIMDSWGIIAPSWLVYLVMTVVSTIVVMAVSGLATQAVLHLGREGSVMAELMSTSAYCGMVLSLGTFFLGSWLKKKLKWRFLNPLLLSILFTVGFLLAFGVDYDSYYEGAKYLSYLLTPATVCLAVPLYEQFEALKKNWQAVLMGILAGVAASLLSILAMAVLFSLEHEEYVTFLPKSITTAIGMGVSEELGGYVPVTVAVIIITGVLGNVVAEPVLRLFRIQEPVAKGIALGTASHAIGTTRAMEMGEVEGAMSSLSIVVSGILTVVGASLFAMFW